MKTQARAFAAVLTGVLAAGGLSGCLTLNPFVPPAPPAVAPTPAAAPKQAGPVTADQINEQNAHEKVKLLTDELEK